MKAKVGELKDEVKEVFSRWLKNELTSVFQVVSGRRRFLVRFQNRYDKYMNSNQLAVVTVDRGPMIK